MPATPKGLSDEKPARMMVALHEGWTLRSFGVKAPHLEVTSAHPVFYGAEDMLDGSSPDAHGVGHMVEPGLHRVQDMFVFPAPDASMLFLRAAWFEFAGGAGLCGSPRQLRA